MQRDATLFGNCIVRTAGQSSFRRACYGTLGNDYDGAFHLMTVTVCSLSLGVGCGRRRGFGVHGWVGCVSFRVFGWGGWRSRLGDYVTYVDNLV